MTLRSDFCFSHFLKNFIISFFFEITLKMFVWVCPMNLWTKKTHLEGYFFKKWPKVKNLFFSKKKFGQIFSKFFAHLKRNLFLILKWFYFLIFAQNWPICEGFGFSFLKIDIFPLWWGGRPGAPWGVKIFPKMVPMIIIGHVLKVYDEKWAKKLFFFFKVSDLYKYSPSCFCDW